LTRNQKQGKSEFNEKKQWEKNPDFSSSLKTGFVIIFAWILRLAMVPYGISIQ